MYKNFNYNLIYNKKYKCIINFDWTLSLVVAKYVELITIKYHMAWNYGTELNLII